MDVPNLAFCSITDGTPLRRLMVGSTLLAAVFANGASADEVGELVSLVNEFRASGEGCGGAKAEQVGPLAPAAALASIPAGAGAQIQQAVSGWLASPGHCQNVMNPYFTEMGAAYATNPRSAATIYWTQVFGTPR